MVTVPGQLRIIKEENGNFKKIVVLQERKKKNVNWSHQYYNMKI